MRLPIAVPRIPSLLLPSVLWLLLALGSTPAAAASATFDNDLEGWEAVGIELDFVIFPPALNSISLVRNTPDMVHEPAGGNPGGYARFTDAIVDPSSFASAPASFLNGGDLSSMIGGTLSFDHRLFDTGMPNDGIAPYAVFFISGDPTNLNALVWSAPPPAGPTDWVHFEIPLDSTALSLIADVPLSVIDPSLPSSFTPGDFLPRGTMSFEEIMANVDTLLVAFELVNNRGVQRQEHGGIDNVMIVPEPGSAALLLGLCVLGLRCRRR